MRTYMYMQYISNNKTFIYFKSMGVIWTAIEIVYLDHSLHIVL